MSRNTKQIPTGRIVKRLAGEGNKISTSAMHIGASAVEASEYMKKGGEAVAAWLKSVGLVLPEPQSEKKGDKRVYKPAAKEWKGAGGVLGTIKRATDGKVTIWLADRAQSALLRDVLAGITQYIETKYKQDVSPCVLTWTDAVSNYNKLPADAKAKLKPEQRDAFKRQYCQPMIVAGAKRLAELHIEKSKVDVLRMAFIRARNILGRAGIKITLPMQTARGKNGGRTAVVKPAFKSFNEMTGAQMFDALKAGGVTEGTLNKLVKYIVDRRERMA
jgi:hypothetical protein